MICFCGERLVLLQLIIKPVLADYQLSHCFIVSFIVFHFTENETFFFLVWKWQRMKPCCLHFLWATILWLFFFFFWRSILWPFSNSTIVTAVPSQGWCASYWSSIWFFTHWIQLTAWEFQPKRKKERKRKIKLIRWGKG